MAAVLLVLVAVCYSRAAWLAAIIALGLLLLSRRPLLAGAFAGAALIAAGAVAWNADALLTLNARYVTRLVVLCAAGPHSAEP